MKFRSILFSAVGSSVLATGLLSVSAPEVNALNLSSGTTCSTGNLTGATACQGQFDGNDSNQDLTGLFGTEVGNNNVVWTELAKAEDDNSWVDGVLSVSNGGEKSGTWSLSSFDETQNLMAVVKAGNGFIAYLLDSTVTSPISNFNWNTVGLTNNGGRQPDISHFSVYTAPGATTTAEPVPEPFTILGSMAALGFGTVLKRKANKA